MVHKPWKLFLLAIKYARRSYTFLNLYLSLKGNQNGDILGGQLDLRLYLNLNDEKDKDSENFYDLSEKYIKHIFLNSLDWY